VPMMTDGGKRLHIALRLKNICDYEEFCEACQAEGIELLPILEYAQKVGMVLVSATHYPNDLPMDAYLRLINTASKATITLPEPNKPVLQPQPQGKCCGGGKVR